MCIALESDHVPYIYANIISFSYRRKEKEAEKSFVGSLEGGGRGGGEIEREMWERGRAVHAWNQNGIEINLIKRMTTWTFVFGLLKIELWGKIKRNTYHLKILIRPSCPSFFCSPGPPTPRSRDTGPELTLLSISPSLVGQCFYLTWPGI